MLSRTLRGSLAAIDLLFVSLQGTLGTHFIMTSSACIVTNSLSESRRKPLSVFLLFVWVNWQVNLPIQNGVNSQPSIHASSLETGSFLCAVLFLCCVSGWILGCALAYIWFGVAYPRGEDIIDRHWFIGLSFTHKKVCECIFSGPT